MANPATIPDLEDRWRPLSTDQETANATALLADAWAMLLMRRPTLEADITAATVTTANVVRVVCAMVLRVLRNPDGLLEESLDDYRYRRDSAISAGALYVSSDELADLTPGRARRNSVRLVVYGDA
jgi:hypothetical protein